jgi:hypothetical protein
VLSAALVAAALVAGLAGAWSPCGLSMVETLAPGGYAQRRRTAAAGALAFALGALAGGTATFGGLAALGDALGAGGGLAAAIAVAALLTAAGGDAAGRRILPQVRRQVPESWRRVLPVPVAAGLYGVLLGLGFTTFVLSFATWGLAAACLAVGTPATGLAVGLAFGAGRALPVIALAPLQDRDGPAAVAAAMAERPAVLRGLRAAAAAGLVLAAVVLVAAPPAARAATRQAPVVVAQPGSDPSITGGLIAWQGADGLGVLSRGGQPAQLPGAHPAVGGALVAWLAEGRIVLADAATLQPVAVHPAPGADALGLSDRLVVWRAPLADGRDAIYAQDLAATGPSPVLVGTARRGGSLGRPVAEGTHVVFDAQSPGLSRILDRDVATGAVATLRSTRTGLLLAPDVDAGRLLYVRSTARIQQLRLGPATVRRGLGADRVAYATTPTARRDAGYEKGHHPHRAGYPGGKRPKAPARPPKGLTVTLWTTALSGDTALLTWLRHRAGRPAESRILSFGV